MPQRRGYRRPAICGSEPMISGAEEKVPVEPGDVQVAQTAACGSEVQSVSYHETAPVVEETPAEEPHIVGGPDTEAGHTLACCPPIIPASLWANGEPTPVMRSQIQRRHWVPRRALYAPCARSDKAQ
ncbi:hypothetical protein MTO96_028625 [Rhipicephalus appendiculatus]